MGLTPTPTPAGTPGGHDPHSCRACQLGDHLNCPAQACRCQRDGHRPRKDTTT